MYEKMSAAHRVALLTAAVAALLIVTAPFAGAADVAKGRQLALNICSKCHEVTGQGARWTDAPSCAAIANDPTTTSASLMSVIQTPHPKMTGSATRNSEDAVDLAAYILSLKRQ